MRVQRVLMPGSEAESWTLLGDDQVPLEPVERFLAYLASVEKSPNTVKAYAHDLKDWFTYLTGHRLDWQTATLEDVAGFVAWLRLPPEGRDGKVAVLPTVAHHCSAASVNRKLAALVSFCEFHARHGVALAVLLVTMQPAGRRGSAISFKPFLHHITKGEPQRRRTIKLKASRPRPKVLTASEVQTILDACDHLRDRLLFALLLDCGVRIGEALGLRHEDMGIAERTVTVMPRPNDNGARAKAGISRAIPASAELMRLYADYLTREYGSLDSDYVFVNLWSQPYGRPWAYAAVYDLVLRLRERTGIDFEPHQYRHTYATWLLRRGAGMETVKECLGHASITTTIDTYGNSRELHRTGEKTAGQQVAGSLEQHSDRPEHGPVSWKDPAVVPPGARSAHQGACIRRESQKRSEERTRGFWAQACVPGRALSGFQYPTPPVHLTGSPRQVWRPLCLRTVC